MASAPRSVRAENVAGGKHWVERDYVARPVALSVGEVGEVGGRREQTSIRDENPFLS